MDTYIRAYMDEAGYVPISLVCGYPHVSYCGAIYSDIVSRLKELGESSVIEIDADNETIRLKEGWDMVRAAVLCCEIYLYLTLVWISFHSFCSG